MNKINLIAIYCTLLILFSFHLIHAEDSNNSTNESRVIVIFDTQAQKNEFIDSLSDAAINNSLTNNETSNISHALETASATVDSSNIADSFGKLPIVTLDVTPEEKASLQNLISNAEIAQIGKKQLFLQTSVPLINATNVWNTTTTISTNSKINLTGKGQTACIIDTGILSTHPDFAGKLIVQQCFCSAEPGTRNTNCCPNGAAQDSNATDIYGHGTHVAGIIAANGAIKGVAPDANIVAVKVFGTDNDLSVSAYDDDLIRAIQFCTDNFAQYNISVISMSLGGGATSSLCPADPLASVITNALNKNISIVVATGNDGFVNAVASPACVPGVTRVASSSKSDTISAFDDTASFVSLVAPGESINSTYNNGGYAVLSGTSMATPHVSGSILLLRQALALANASETTSQIENNLNSTGQLIFSGARNQLFSRINVFAALKSLANIFLPKIFTINTTHPRYGQNLNVTINSSAFFSFANISQLVVQQNNATYNSSTDLWTTTLANNINGTISIIAIDSYNSTRNTNISVVFDDTPPQTQLTLTLANGTQILNSTTTLNTSAWYNQSITITANATDNLNGVSVTQIGLGSSYGYSNWTNLTNSTSNITLAQQTDDGFVSYRSIDSVGNVESSKRIPVNVDKTAPTITPLLFPPSLVQSNETFIVRLSVTDNESGVAQVIAAYWQQNVTLTHTIGNNYDGIIISPANASPGQLAFIATDYAGNSNELTQNHLVFDGNIIISPHSQNNSQISNNTQLTFDLFSQTQGNLSINGVIVKNITNESNTTLTNAQWQNATNLTIEINLTTSNPNMFIHQKFNYTIDTTPPTLQIPTFVNNVNGTISFLVNATDAAGIDTVNLTTTCGQQKIKSTIPYLFSVDTLACADGVQNITISANDTNGLFTTQNTTINVTNQQTVTVTVQNSIATFEQTPFTSYVRQISGLNSTNVTLIAATNVTNSTLNQTIIIGTTNTELLVLAINATTDNTSYIAISIPTNSIVNISNVKYWINHSASSTLDGPYTPTDIVLNGNYYDMTLTTTNFSTFVVAQTYPACSVGGAVTQACVCSSTITFGGFCCSGGPSATSCPAPAPSGGGGGGGGGRHGGSGSSGGYSGPAPVVATKNVTNIAITTNITNVTVIQNVTATEPVVEQTSNDSQDQTSAPVLQTLQNTNSSTQTIVEICIGLLCGLVVGIWILKK